MNSNLMPQPVHLLDGRVISVLVGHEECGLDVALVGVLAAIEDKLVQVHVVIVDGVVESECDHLGHSSRIHIVGNLNEGESYG